MNKITTLGLLGLLTFAGTDSVAVKPSKNDPTRVKTELKQNYPNPVYSMTTIEYTLSRDSDVSLTLYDLAGRKCGALVDEFQKKGKYEIRLKKPDYHPGIYLYKLTTPDTTIVKKMLFAK